MTKPKPYLSPEESRAQWGAGQLPSARELLTMMAELQLGAAQFREGDERPYAFLVPYEHFGMLMQYIYNDATKPLKGNRAAQRGAASRGKDIQARADGLFARNRNLSVSAAAENIAKEYTDKKGLRSKGYSARAIRRRIIKK